MKIYKIRTNAYDAFVTVDDDNKVCYFTTAAFVYDVNIRDVEDDTSWEDSCMGMDFDEFMGMDEYDYNDPEKPMIIDATDLCPREKVNTYHFDGDHTHDAYDVVEYDDGECAIQASDQDGYECAYYDFCDAGLELPDRCTGGFYGREVAGYAACREFIRSKKLS